MPMICTICGYVYFSYIEACPNCVKENINEPNVVIITNNDEHVCPYCAPLNQKIMSLSQFLKHKPIPGECEHPIGCRCYIQFKKEN